MEEALVARPSFSRRRSSGVSRLCPYCYRLRPRPNPARSCLTSFYLITNNLSLSRHQLSRSLWASRNSLAAPISRPLHIKYLNLPTGPRLRSRVDTPTAIAPTAVNAPFRTLSFETAKLPLSRSARAARRVRLSSQATRFDAISRHCSCRSAARETPTFRKPSRLPWPWSLL